MIEIKIDNHQEVAESKSFLAKFVPKKMLEHKVEKAIAKNVTERLTKAGVKAVVTVTK